MKLLELIDYSIQKLYFQTNWIFGILLKNDYEETKWDSGNKYDGKFC